MPDPTGWRRWWVYQHERFPLAAHGPLILAFSACAVGYSAHLRGRTWPTLGAVLVAFITSLLFFLQLRIADEFKDQAEDARWRPYRPVPRGLVRLRELGLVFVGAAVVQLGLGLWWSPPQVLVLLIAWSYLAAMSVEFGCRTWLKQHPIVYLWSHMMIMPLVDLYATACDWSPVARRPSHWLLPFLAASFANGVVIELGRKIRSPGDEEQGVETYSSLWGPRQAIIAWIAMIALTAILATIAALGGDAAVPVAVALGGAAVACLIIGMRFLARHGAGAGTRVELAAGLWTLMLYMSLGILPPLWAYVHG
jgi:4-hydroxybenzoate polyprenyltransferase